MNNTTTLRELNVKLDEILNLWIEKKITLKEWQEARDAILGGI